LQIDPWIDVAATDVPLRVFQQQPEFFIATTECVPAKAGESQRIEARPTEVRRFTLSKTIASQSMHGDEDG
jgi:hypothetical protein